MLVRSLPGLVAAFAVLGTVGLVAQSSDGEARAARLALLQEAAGKKPVAGSAEQRVGDLYAGLVDDARINSLGLEPLKEDLAKIAKAAALKDIATLYGQGNFIYCALRTDIRPDPTDATRRVAAISQSGLDMHDSEPYLSMEPKAVEVREKFVIFLSKMLDLVDAKESRARAEKILALETAIARVCRTKDREADAAKQKQSCTLAEWSAQAPGFDWSAYLQSNGIDASTRLWISQPDVVAAVAKTIEATELATLKDHLTFSIICTWGWYGALPRSIFELQFDFYGKTRRGKTEVPTRLEQAYNFVSDRLTADVEALAKAKAANDPASVSSPSPGPEIRRDDVYGNAKRIHFWNWEKQRKLLTP